MAAATKSRSRSAQPVVEEPEVEVAEPSALEAIAEVAADRPEQPAGHEPLVDLDDVAPDRPTVRFQGQLYDMRILDDFGIRAQQQLTRDGREFFRLWSSDDELTEADGQRLEQLLERMFEQVLDAPDEVKADFTDGKKSQVVLGFTLAPLAQRTAQMHRTDQEARDSDPTTGS